MGRADARQRMAATAARQCWAALTERPAERAYGRTKHWASPLTSRGRGTSITCKMQRPAAETDDMSIAQHAAHCLLSQPLACYPHPTPPPHPPPCNDRLYFPHLPPAHHCWAGQQPQPIAQPPPCTAPWACAGCSSPAACWPCCAAVSPGWRGRCSCLLPRRQRSCDSWRSGSCLYRRRTPGWTGLAGSCTPGREPSWSRWRPGGWRHGKRLSQGD